MLRLISPSRTRSSVLFGHRPWATSGEFICALGLGETLGLTWDDIEIDEPDDPCVHIRQGKTVNAKRDLDLMPPAVAILQRRKSTSTVPWIFPNEAETDPAINTTVDHQHKRVRDALHLDLEFVLHSLRHTALTRLVDSGTDSFTLKMIAGHDSVVTSERYIHKSPQAAKAAMARRYRADVAGAGHRIGTRRKPVKAKSLQTAVIKQAGA